MNLALPAASTSAKSAALSLDDLRLAARGDKPLIARISAALRSGDASLLETAQTLSATNAASLILRLEPADARALLARLPDKPNLAVLSVLDPAIRARLIDDDERSRLSRMVAGLDVAAAAEILVGLPDSMVDVIVSRHPRRGELRAAIARSDETAGGAMVRRKFVAAPLDWTIEQAIAEIRAHSADIDNLDAVYVVDGEKRLIGYLRLSDLLTQPGTAVVRDIMRTDSIAVAASSDREEVVRVADRERVPVVPVTDDAGRLIGLVGAEEIRAIEREEVSEDLKALSSVAPDSDPHDTPLQILRRRFPWLASALAGALGAGLIVGSFEEALEEAVILASLIPLVMDMAGNAGIQSSAVTIEAMATGSLWGSDIKGRFVREVLGAILNGAAVGLVTAIGILALSMLFHIDAAGWLALTAFATLILITVQAAAVGVLVPMALKKMNYDPAVGTGVFITTVNDFAGITILFLMAKLIYLPHL